MIAINTPENLTPFLESNPEWIPHADLLVIPPTPDEALEEYPELEGSDLLASDRLTTFGYSRLSLYVRLRRDQQKHRFAEMVAMQAAPRCMTDDVFFAGLPSFNETMTKSNRDFIVRQAQRHGYTPPPDAIYQSGLARFPGDPEAFITRAMGRHYVKRLCEKRGWACEGAVSVQGRDDVTSDPLATEKCVPLAEDLVREKARAMAAKNPDIKKLSRAELRKQIIQKHGPTA